MNKYILIVGTAVASAAAGGAGGYFLAKKRVTDTLNRLYNDQMEEEISRMRKHLAVIPKEKINPEAFVQETYGTSFATETESLARIADGLAQSLGYTEKLDEDVEHADEDEEWIIVAAREQALLEDVQAPNVPEFDAPYVISRDVFAENEYDNTQVSWTFFNKDNALVDEDGDEVDAVEDFVGNDNLGCFGTGGSMDKNVVFVRNNRLQMDFEIIRHRGAHSEEDDYRGPKRPQKKFRQDADD